MLPSTVSTVGLLMDLHGHIEGDVVYSDCIVQLNVNVLIFVQ